MLVPPGSGAPQTLQHTCSGLLGWQGLPATKFTLTHCFYEDNNTCGLGYWAMCQVVAFTPEECQN